MPRKRPRLNINSDYTPVRETADDTSSFVKNFYRLLFGLLFLYVFISLFLGPKNFESEIVTDVDYKMYSGGGRSKYGGGGSPSTDITVSTTDKSEYFVSTPPGGRPFKIGDTVLVFSNLFNRTVGISKGQFYYEIGRSRGLLILLSITSFFSFLFSLLGDFRNKYILYIIIIMNGGLLLLFMS
jgi:hypothetical protein